MAPKAGSAAAQAEKQSIECGLAAEADTARVSFGDHVWSHRPS